MLREHEGADVVSSLEITHTCQCSNAKAQVTKLTLFSWKLLLYLDAVLTSNKGSHFCSLKVTKRGATMPDDEMWVHYRSSLGLSESGFS